ncbi:hypothetical protein WA588_000493, partial [Blastocystis sp. NMH]
FSIWSLLLWVALIAAAQSEIEFPNAITAEFITIAHQIPETSEYPLREKHYSLYYDRTRQAGRIEQSMENGVKVTDIRDYKAHYEVHIESIDGEDVCEYSYLGESFPEPQFPDTISFLKQRVNKDRRFNLYNYQHYRQYVDITVDAETHQPVRIDEYDVVGQKAKPVFSTVYTTVSSAVDASVFDVTALIQSGKCTRNSKGWPYHLIFGPF